MFSSSSNSIFLFQFNSYNVSIKQFFQHIEAGYVEGKPLHIADPEKSGFAILSKDEFDSMEPHKLHALLSSKNLVVTGWPHGDMDFKEGLESLTELDAQISIQGE